MIGKTISHYKLVEKIGEGGMGQVYLAEDLELHRRVAIKFLPAEYASDSDALSRFKREGQAAAALDHPNIVTIYDVGEYESRPYIVMSYVKGDTLGAVVAREDLTLERSLTIATSLCEALSCAHAASVVHRDIKPDNIVIGRDGRPKILDFGLARLRGVTKLTKEASTVGTISYMSPEQVRGEEVDHRSDIFSLGAVMYEMIAGRPPFTGDHAAAVMYSITNEQPQPLMRYNNAVTDDLERIVTKTMAKDRNDRYQNADDLLVDLRAVQTSRPDAKRAAASRRSFTTPLLVVSAVAVLAAVGYFVLKDRNAPQAEDRKSIAVLPFQNMSADPENEYFSEGITDDIIAQLNKIADLRVVSRTTVMRYKNTEKSVREIGAELGVATILEGSVRRSGGKVRVVSQLIDARSDENIWASTYDRDLEEIFKIQSDVAERIANSLQAVLTPEEAERIQITPTANMTAYDYYLRGRQCYYRYRKEENENAIVFFKKALANDPNYALALSGLGDAYGQRVLRFGFAQAWIDSSLQASERAIAIEPGLSEGYKAVAVGYLIRGWYGKALQNSMKAAQLDPNNVAALGNIGWCNLRMGRPDEALPWFRKVLVKEPDQVISTMGIGMVYFAVNEWAKARQWLTATLNLQPDESSAKAAIIASYALEGRLDEARRMEDAVLEAHPDNVQVYLAVTLLELKAGRLDRAIEVMESAATRATADADARSSIDVNLGCLLVLRGERERAGPLFERAEKYLQEEIERGNEDAGLRMRMAQIRAAEGEKEEALAWLDRFLEFGELYYLGIEDDPVFDGLRNDDRFRRVVVDMRARVEAMRRRVLDQEASS